MNWKQASAALVFLPGFLLAAEPEFRPADLPMAASQAFKASPKRGIGHWGSPDPVHPETLKNLPVQGVVRDLKVSWWYNWWFTGNGEEKVKGFVPQIWGRFGPDEEKALGLLKGKGYDTLLTFNEPDIHGQSVMTVDEIVGYWPKLEATGLRLASPAPGNPNWLDGFMAAAAKKKLRVDFVTLHLYPHVEMPNAVEWVRDECREAWLKFGKPVWVTEFSAPAFPWFAHHPTMAENARFARDASLILDSLPFVERYAWYSSGPGAREGTGSGFYDPTSLYVKPGEMAPAGIAYRDACLRPDLGMTVSVKRAGKPEALIFKVIGFDLWPDGEWGPAALEYGGYLQVPEKGEYYIYLYDAGSAFSLGGKELVKSDKTQDKASFQGVKLEAGRHAFTVKAVRKDKKSRLRVAISGPGMARQGFPLDAIFLPGSQK